MKQIDVQITKGQIEGFAVEMKDGLPTVTASVGLYTAGNKKITTFSISTVSYYENNFELPIEMILPIQEIANRLEAVTIQHCNKALCMIEATGEVVEE